MIRPLTLYELRKENVRYLVFHTHMGSIAYKQDPATCDDNGVINRYGEWRLKHPLRILTDAELTARALMYWAFEARTQHVVVEPVLPADFSYGWNTRLVALDNAL